MGRVGIELSPLACRIVEIDGRRSRGGRAPETRVISYAVLPAGGADMFERLAALRRRDAAVVVWGMRTAEHRADVSPGRYDRMRAEALASARDAGMSTDGMFADIAPAGPWEKGAGRRAVIAAMAAGDEVTLAVQPIVDAGLSVRSVTTPAGALVSLARTRRDLSVPEGIDAYVALEEMATAVALVRDGALVAARELPWGYLRGADASPQPREREDIAARLVVDLAALCSTSGSGLASLGQVAICGGLAELRSMTASMMEGLDAEVEPLDALFGIDEEHLPEPADSFRERSAELRLAWAVAADWPAPINLIRHRRRRARKTALARAAVVAGVGAGLGTGWLIEQSAWWQSPAGAARTSPARATPRATEQPPKPVTIPPSVARVTPPGLPPAPAARPSPPPALLTPAPPTRTPTPALLTPGQPTPAPAPSPVPLPPASPPARAAALPPSASRPPASIPVARSASTPPAAASLRTPEPRAAEPSLPAVVAPPRAPIPRTPVAARPKARPGRSRERAPAPPTPFDAVLGSILYSSDRKLAIIDGRIVGPGDEVKGARVVDITTGGVTLRDGQGRLRTLVLASPGQ